MDLKPSIILKSIWIESLIFAKVSKTYFVVLTIVWSYEFVISTNTPSQSKIMLSSLVGSNESST